MPYKSKVGVAKKPALPRTVPKYDRDVVTVVKLSVGNWLWPEKVKVSAEKGDCRVFLLLAKPWKSASSPATKLKPTNVVCRLYPT